jgi:hypothetical protein
MSGVIGKRASLGQANGPEVELIVSGTADYATYETPDGYPAIYDQQLGLFCYARVDSGEYQSTSVPLSAPPPAGVVLHARESDSVRARKINDRQSRRERRAQGPPQQE